MTDTSKPGQPSRWSAPGPFRWHWVFWDFGPGRRWRQVEQEVWLRERAPENVSRHARSAGGASQQGAAQSVAEEYHASATDQGVGSFETDARLLVNLFVEKAQVILTRRAGANFALGIACIVAAAAVAFVFFCVSFEYELFYEFWDRLGVKLARRDPNSNPTDAKTGDTLLIVLQMTGMTGVALGASAYLFFLSRAFLHEWAKAHNQVHALRFGRLAWHLLRHQTINAKELKEMFSWNLDSATGFVREPFQNFYRGSDIADIIKAAGGGDRTGRSN